MDLKKDVAEIKSNIDRIKAEGLTIPYHIELAFLERYPKLYDKYPFLVKKICTGENLEMLDKMLNSIANIEKGADKFEEEKKLGEELGKKYIKKDD